MDVYQSWIGTGFEGGGTIVIPGIEYVAGTLHNAGFWDEMHEFQVLNIRMGLGIGGGAGAVVFFLFNCMNLWSLNETNLEDWNFDVNVAVAAKWSSIAKALRTRKLLPLLREIGLRSFSPGEMSAVRDLMSYIYGLYELDAKKGPKLFAVELPGAGVGLEVSAHFTLVGQIEILS